MVVTHYLNRPNYLSKLLGNVQLEANLLIIRLHELESADNHDILLTLLMSRIIVFSLVPQGLEVLLKSSLPDQYVCSISFRFAF